MEEFKPKPKRASRISKNKKPKTSHNSKPAKPDQKMRSPYSEARDVLGYFQEIGDRQNWIMEKLELWSKLDTSINFFDFLDVHGIPESTYYDILGRDAQMHELHHRAKQRIGSRREKMAIYKYHECNEKPLLHSLRLYHEDWKKIHDEDVKNKRDLADKGIKEPIHVTVDHTE